MENGENGERFAASTKRKSLSCPGRGTWPTHCSASQDFSHPILIEENLCLMIYRVSILPASLIIELFTAFFMNISWPGTPQTKKMKFFLSNNSGWIKKGDGLIRAIPLNLRFCSLISCLRFWEGSFPLPTLPATPYLHLWNGRQPAVHQDGH